MRSALVVSAFGLLLALGVRCAAQQFVTQDQAKQAVRDFEGDQALQFDRISLDSDPTDPVWSYPHYYDLDCETGRDDFWEVEATTGEVCMVNYGNAQPPESTEEPFGPLTRAQCLQIAENYARSKFTGFDTMGFQLDSPEINREWDGYGWSFSWHQVVAYGALTPNGLSVDVNPADGRIQCYSSHRVPTPIPAEPHVTSQTALVTAQASTVIQTFTEIHGPLLIAEPTSTYWDMGLAGLDSAGKSAMYIIEVDAYTGEILNSYSDAAGSAPGHMSLPGARARGGKAGNKQDSSADWVSARDTFTRLGYSLAWDARTHQVTAKSGTCTIVLKAGSRDVFAYGRRYELSGSPKIVKGRLQIPGDFARQLAECRPK